MDSGLIGGISKLNGGDNSPNRSLVSQKWGKTTNSDNNKIALGGVFGNKSKKERDADRNTWIKL
jgi:hypothetical protein